MLTFAVDSLTNPGYVINFPTKQHWRGGSRLKYVEQGLESLVSEIRRLNLESVVVPSLVCGGVGPNWEREVPPLIEEALSGGPEVEAYVYESSEE